MRFCEECGGRLTDTDRHCPACGAAVRGAAGAAPARSTPPASGLVPPRAAASPVRDAAASMGANAAAAGAAIRDSVSSKINQATDAYNNSTAMYRSSSQGLVYSDDEKVVRTYLCSSIKSPRSEGYLTVTNRRVIFQAQSATSRIIKEVPLDSVSGLDCYYGTNVNVRSIALAVIILLISIILVGVTGMAWIIAIGLLIAGWMIYRAFRKSFFLSVYSSKAMGMPIQLGEGPRGLLGNGALYTLASLPTADTDKMINELGAMIMDLQNLGDNAITKWKR